MATFEPDLTPESKRIAVIGAGIAGIGAAAGCLEQNLRPVVFEQTSFYGGLWRYHPDIDEDGIASVMRTTVINTSKEVSSFSLFPPKAEYPNYMHNTLNIEYYENFARAFNFEKYVRLHHRVVSIEMAPDHTETGRWIVKFIELQKDANKIQEEIFDGVLICVGHHNVRNEPRFPDQELFKGKIMHTHSLKTAQGFEDKNVVVVGIGNSATDAAVEISAVTKQVYMSTRRGAWLFRRVAHNGMPFDLITQRRFVWFLMKILPYSFACWCLERYLNRFFDHELYQIKPKHRALSAHITMNDALPAKIMCGFVKVKGDIERFTEDGVIFQGEKDVTPCDVVILGTGYKVFVPFISKDILPVGPGNKVRLYKHQFIPNIPHPHTLGVIGLFQSVGAGIPVGELQVRWYALLNAGKLPKLPSPDKMAEDIDQREKVMRERYYDSPRHTFQVDWLPFMDELAEEIGCAPPLWKYLFTDPKLFFALIFGIALPYQFRLTGPGAWPEARQTILTVDKRIHLPFNTRTGYIPPKSGFKLKSFLLLAIFPLLFVYRLFFS